PVIASPGFLFAALAVPRAPAITRVAQDHVGFAAAGEVAEAHDLPIEADIAQEGGIGDVVVADVVDLESSSVRVAQQHVGGVSADEAAEARELPSGSDLAYEISCQDRVVADVVDLIEAVGTTAQDHVGGGASRWGRVRVYHRHQVPTEDVHVDEIGRRDLVYDAGGFEKIERVGAGRVPTRYKLDPIT